MKNSFSNSYKQPDRIDQIDGHEIRISRGSGSSCAADQGIAKAELTKKPPRGQSRRSSAMQEKASSLKIIDQNGKLGFSGGAEAIAATFGTADPAVAAGLFLQAINACPKSSLEGLEGQNQVLAALHGIGPQDVLEGMLAAQMVAVHTFSMEFFKKVAATMQTGIGLDVNLNRATKLSNLFRSQMETLQRYREQGGHNTVVEQVHVHGGAQAIVGAVSRDVAKGRRGSHDDND